MRNRNVNRFTKRINSIVRGPSIGVMLFGSVSRGDHSESSDIDVLQLVENYFPSYRVNRYNISVYTAYSLQRLATSGSLFVLHLLKEGSILYDKEGVLKNIVSSYKKPRTNLELLIELSECLSFLRVVRKDYLVKPFACNQMVFYLLRTSLFAYLDSIGKPEFSMVLIPKLLCDNRIGQVVKLKVDLGPDLKMFDIAFKLAVEYIERNPDWVPGANSSSSGKNSSPNKLANFLLNRFFGIVAPIQGY